MKLRIKGDSLRLRISPSEMDRLLQAGRIEETVHFGAQHDAKLTYALITSSENPAQGADMDVLYRDQEITVSIAAPHARGWAQGSQVGIYAAVNTGAGQLQLAVEKDFACLDNSEAENHDTFPNPNQAAVC
jgi:hypothetical protein